MFAVTMMRFWCF